jgi:hypothetical protein
LYSGMLHAHKNRPHLSALRNKDNHFFIICLKCPTPPGRDRRDTWDKWDTPGHYIL